MKKLKLNKKVIIDLNNSEMNDLRGGSDYLCTNFATCNPPVTDTETRQDGCLNTNVVCPTPEMSSFCNSGQILCWDSAIC